MTYKMNINYLNMPSNGSIRGSHASNCVLKVDAAIEEISTAFIASGEPCVASFKFVTVVSKSGFIWSKPNFDYHERLKTKGNKHILDYRILFL